MGQISSFRRQQYFQESPRFIILKSGLNVCARFLEVSPSAIKFFIDGLTQEKLTVVTAEFLVNEFEERYTTIYLDSDGDFTDNFIFMGKSITGTFTLYGEGHNYFLRLAMIF